MTRVVMAEYRGYKLAKELGPQGQDWYSAIEPNGVSVDIEGDEESGFYVQSPDFCAGATAEETMKKYAEFRG